MERVLLWNLNFGCQISVKCSNSDAFFHYLATAADKEVLLDHVATMRYGLIFRFLEFTLSFEPTRREGPDLLITRDGMSATVEVTRFKPTNSGGFEMQRGVASVDELRSGIQNPLLLNDREVQSHRAEVNGNLQTALEALTAPRNFGVVFLDCQKRHWIHSVSDSCK